MTDEQAVKTRRVRTLVLAICVLVLVGLLFTIRSRSSHPGSVDYAVYSSYIEAGLTGNSHDLGDRRGIIVVDERTNMESGLTLIQRLEMMSTSLTRLRTLVTAPQPSLIFKLFVANIGTYKLDRRFDISAAYQFLDSKALTNPAYRLPPQSYGYVTFSSIAFSRDLTEALFYTEHICGLCGGGEFVVMRKLHGVWVIVNRYGTWVS